MNAVRTSFRCVKRPLVVSITGLLYFAYAMYLILSPPCKTILNRKDYIYFIKYNILQSKNASKQ